MSYIHPTAVIAENVIIEEDVYIGPLCVIGFPAEWKGKKSTKGVKIGKGAVLTGLVTVDAGVERMTVIGKGSYLMKHSHVGHDAILFDNVTLSCGAKVGGHTVIQSGTNVGLNAVIHQKLTIPEGCMIGASAFIGKKTELKPYRKYAGVPAKDIGSNESFCNIPELPSEGL